MLTFIWRLAHLQTQARFDETALQWEQLEQLARQFKRHLRPLLLTVTFSAVRTDAPLLHAVAFLQEAYRKGKPLSHYPTATFPSAFIPENSKRYLYQSLADGQQRIRPDRYEFLVYRLLRHGLEAGDIFCRESVRFRSFEDDLVPEHQWQQKEALIATTGLTSLQRPIQEHLATLEQLLEARIVAVNQRLLTAW